MKLYANTHRMSQVSALVTFLVTLLISSNAFGVAGFARQTGMSCNQCHTSHGGATPNFTFTGKKFNAMGYRIPSIQISDIEKGKPEDKGEYLSLKPNPLSGRFQWTALSNSADNTTGVWRQASTNPTSRFAMFPYIGPIGENFGVWTEFYIVPLLGNEWGIASTSYEEHDFRYIFDPDNRDYTIGLALTNQSIREIFGFGPWPAVGMYSDINRGGIGGYTHPNKANIFTYGWMHDRWVWAAGLNTGDTNMGWDKFNTLAMFGYAIRNTNANELWANIYFRTGNDALPLVTRIFIASNSSFDYADGVSGVTATRLVTDPYKAGDVTGHNTMDVEVRWSRQDMGPWSYEMVGRLIFSTEDYSDGGKTARDSWAIATQFGWKHTYYFKPYIKGRIKYDFTDQAGTLYNIDTALAYGFWLGYKPVENFFLTFEYHNLQSLALNNPVQANGARYAIVADISF